MLIVKFHLLEFGIQFIYILRNYMNTLVAIYVRSLRWIVITSVSSPNGTLFYRIHFRTNRAIEIFRESWHVGKRTNDSKFGWWMCVKQNIIFHFFGFRFAAPSVGSSYPEKLFGTVLFESRKSWFFAVFTDEFFISVICSQVATIVSYIFVDGARSIQLELMS